MQKSQHVPCGVARSRNACSERIHTMACPHCLCHVPPVGGLHRVRNRNPSIQVFFDRCAVDCVAEAREQFLLKFLWETGQHDRTMQKPCTDPWSFGSNGQVLCYACHGIVSIIKDSLKMRLASRSHAHCWQAHHTHAPCAHHLTCSLHAMQESILESSTYIWRSEINTLSSDVCLLNGARRTRGSRTTRDGRASLEAQHRKGV
jgi:hypothetical protein